MAEFRMPALGADMETGTVVEWLVKPGAHVRSGDVVAVVETHKGAIDVECFLDGIIGELVPVGQALPVGAVLAQVLGPGEVAAASPPGEAQARVGGETAVTQPGVPVAALGAPAATRSARPKVSPAARRRAAELGLDPERLSPGTADGAVTLADVERSAGAQGHPRVPSAPAAAPAPLRAARGGFDPAQMRQAIAAAMGRSKREIPHYYLGTTVDFARAQAWLEAYNAARLPAERLLAAVLLLKATALALRATPQLNGFYENDTFRPSGPIHVGWAISLRGGGLVAPAIHDADRLGLPQLMTALRDLVQRARAGGLRGSELSDPTVTVTSLGDRGAESVLGVIYPPQVAILGFGRVVTRPWVVDGAVVARPLLSVSLAADHRASDGHLGSQLLAAIDEALQHPDEL